MGIAIGIDLGTTNSATCLKKVTTTPIRNAEGEELTPSCVTAVPNTKGAFDFIVGRASRDLLKQYPEQTIISVKRLMGRDFDDHEVQNIITENRTSYTIETDPTEPGSIRIPLGGKSQTPEMISSLILKKLIRDGEAELQGNIDQAIVTVPAYFSDRQKFATRAACDYAGIKLLRLLPEPTAAALSFGLTNTSKDDCRTLMVFDLGGGTFDISVLSFAGESFMEITKGGDMWLGGDNIDQLIIDHVFKTAQEFNQCAPITNLLEQLSPAENARFLAEIREKAEKAKIELSTQDTATIEMFGLLKDENKKLVDIDVTLSRKQFAELLQPVVRRIANITKQILHEIRFEPELIDTVLMVGGSSLIPAIQKELKNIFGADKVMIHPRPMLAIAEGAALMAAKMTSAEKATEDAFTMMHTTAHDYYLQLANGKRHLLIARNTPLPAVVEEKLSFLNEDQTLARLRIFNEVDGILDTVGELWFHNENPETKYTKQEKNASELMLRFSVDEDNIITMKAWALGDEQQATETQIARGGLATKLYNDLERTLSSIIANCHKRSTGDDALCLSHTIISTILNASDPITGETHPDQKRKAEQQINTIKQLQEKNLSPLNLYHFGLSAQTSAQRALSDEQNTYLKNLVDNLKQALKDLDNITVLQELSEKLNQFFDNHPIAGDLSRAENAAMILEDDKPSVAKEIRRTANTLIDTFLRKENTAFEDVKEKLYTYIDPYLYWSDAPEGRFDRDVCL